MAGKRGPDKVKRVYPPSRKAAPQFVATDEQRNTVKRLTAFGFTEEEIPLFVINPKTGKPISRNTLLEHFRFELDYGALELTEKVCAVLARSITEDNNLTAAMFWLKTRRQWRETSPVSAVEFKKGASGAINVTVTNYAG